MKFFVFLSLFSSALFAHPSGHKVIQGKANITTAQNRCKIQTDNKTIIHWDDFSINKGEVTQFIQNSKNSVVLNRVVGKDISKIFGKLEANGKVYLINPQGILIGDTGVINTNSFIGSTLDLADAEFTKGGALTFKGNNNSSIVNLGTITSQDGSIYLLGYEIKNKGIIEAKKNTVGLAAVNEVFLQPKNQLKIFIKIDTKSLGTLENSGTIKAFKTELHGLTNPFTLAINNSGKIHASSLENKDGQIFIKAHRGKLDIGGQITNEKGETIIEARDLNIGKEAAIVDKLSGKIAFNLSGLHFEHLGLIKTYGGDISIHAEKAHFTHGGILNSSGGNGGNISIFSNSINNFGKTVAEGTEKKGGKVSYFIGNTVVENRVAITSVKGKTSGGQILYKTGKILSSGTMISSGKDGGSISLFADHINLPAAKLYANGLEKGGKIHIDIKNVFDKPELYTDSIKQKGTLRTNSHTVMKVEGSKKKGSIYTFIPLVQKQSAEILGAPCDISNQIDLVDPIDGTLFGDSVAILDNGNVIVTKPSGQTGALTDVGAFMLYNGTNGELINYATGRIASDRVGSGGIVKLEGNNNFVIISPEWRYPPGTAYAGAVTFVKGNLGLAGTVNTSNSLYGTNISDQVGSRGSMALVNGNYVVTSPNWDSPLKTNAGAATWVDGSTGFPSGELSAGASVSTTNSLYGATTNDSVSNRNATILTNGNYVVLSYLWDSPAVANAGAATWIDGSTGYPSGAISAGASVNTTNSLYGTSVGDQVGYYYGLALTNGNYVVLTPYWNGIVGSGGAATWVDGSTGRPFGAITAGAPVSTANSLYGTNMNDRVGSKNGQALADSGLALTNGNYVVLSRYWNNAAGAATRMNGASGTDAFGNVGAPVSTANSLYGSAVSDLVGFNGAALINDNYVILSPYWNGVTGSGGAATWVDGDTGYPAGATSVGTPVSVANSLYGTRINNYVGFPKAVALQVNGNYVVLSDLWDRPAATNVGAATWVDGSTGYPSGAVSAGTSVSTTNSLHGTSTADLVGYDAVALTNGNYVVLSQDWDGVAGNGGAATWIDGNTGHPVGMLSAGAPVSTTNSLYGTGMGDYVGFPGVVALSNGNYVVLSTYWDNGLTLNAGAATCADGEVGTIGPVTTFNSIVGNTSGAGNPPNMFAVIQSSGGGFAVSFPSDGNGRVVIVGIQAPIPPTPPTPTPTPTVKEKEKALYAFYRSIADNEMGQKWNFWPGADFSKPFIVNHPNKTEIRIINQGPFFPHYQERDPFKFED